MCFLDQKTHLPLSQISWNRLNICSAQFLSRAQRHDILQYLVSTWVIWLWNLTFFAWLPYEPVAGFPLPSSALLCSKAVSKSAKTYTEDLKSRAPLLVQFGCPTCAPKNLAVVFLVSLHSKRLQEISNHSRISSTDTNIIDSCFREYPITLYLYLPGAF